MRSFTHLEGWLRAGALTAIAAFAVALPAQDSTRAPAPDSARPAVPDTARAAAPDTTQAAAADTTHAAAPDTTAAGPRHLVKKGDTLWDLAHLYLSDPFRWPEIYRLNTDLVQDPHWIFPGQKLRIPGASGAASAADSTGSVPGARLAAADENTPYFQPQQLSGSARSTGPTVFSMTPEKRYSADPTLSASPSAFPHTPVRRGEFEAAPWVDREGGPRAAGQIVASVQIPGIADASQRTRLSTEERAYITLPAGATATVGERFVAFALGTELADGSQVMVPTGIMEVERVGQPGEATTARLVQQFGAVIIGQGVMPLEQFSMSTDAVPQQTTIGTESSVVAIPSGAVLPSIERYVILGTTAKDGVKLGDEFTLYRPRQKMVVPSGDARVQLPEEPIALAQVVRVTDRGTTAIILAQRQPAIKTGVRARLTARMP